MDANQTIFMPSVQPSIYALSMQQQNQQQMQQVQQQQVAAVAQRLVQQQQQQLQQQQQQRTRPENPKLQTSLQKQAQSIFNTSPSAAALNDFTLGQAAFTGNDYFSDIDYSPLTPKSSEPSFSPAELTADSDLDSWPNISLNDNIDSNDDFGFFAKTESTTSPNFYNNATNNTSFFPMQGRSLFETSAINPLQLSKDGFGAELTMSQQSQQSQQQQPKQEIMDDEFGLFGSSPNMSSSMPQQQQSMDTITIPRDARGAVRKPSGSHSRIASDASSIGRKRKTMSMASSPESSATPQSPPNEASSSKQAPHSRKKTAHNVIEKRYRTNLNDKILALRDAVPSLRVTKDRKSKQNMPFSDEDEAGYDNGETAEELGGLLPAHKLNKATILGKATEYISHLEKQNDYLERYIVSLECTLRGLKDQGRQ